ncbi:MAG: hypothetical protein WAM72_01490 [Xanthobacteraceae bacterium]
MSDRLPISLGALWDRLNDPRRRATPETVIEAILWTVRERGVAALDEPANIERLSRCDAAAVKIINERIERLTAAEVSS